MLDAIGAIDVQPQVHIDLQSVLDAVAAGSKAAHADAKRLEGVLGPLGEAAREDAENLAEAIAKLDAESERRSGSIIEDLASWHLVVKDHIQESREEMKGEIGEIGENQKKLAEKCADIEKTSREGAGTILGVTSAAFAQADATYTVGLRQLLDAIGAIDLPSLDPVLEAIETIDFSSVTDRIDTNHVATLIAVKDASVDLEPVLQAMTKNKEALTSGLDMLQRLDSESKTSQKAILDVVTHIDAKPPVDLGPLHKLVAQIDAKPPVDLQPVWEAISAIEIHPIVKVDTRPVIDTMAAGLARIEIAWAQVDLGEVSGLLKKIDAKLLEAIVKIDAKDPNRSSNFIWSSAHNQWT